MTVSRELKGLSSFGEIKVNVAVGTAAAADVVVAGMTVGDELISVLAILTAAAGINTPQNRTAEYGVQAGGLNKPAGTNDAASDLIIIWRDLT